jgi:anti-sigma-K factor RskA
MAAPLSCDHCEELLADYLLHALEPEAVQAVTEHFSTCARCRAQLTASEAVLAHLAQGVPQRAPPSELGSRLLATAVEGALFTASARRPGAHPVGPAGPSS